MTSIGREAPTFLMTPTQHREWARILHLKGKAREGGGLHEQLAKARLRGSRMTTMPIACPPLSRAAQKKPRVERG
jgi:hypothetical protein